jgi:predicted MFS family arabinose efflux permease
VVGALGAARAGRWPMGTRAVDDGRRPAAVAGRVAAAQLCGGGPVALVVGIIVLDLAGQAIHVTNQSLIFQDDSDAHSRLVACYMLFYAVGSGLGAIAATSVYALAGWHGVCALGAAVSLLALLFWRLTLPTEKA